MVIVNVTYGFDCDVLAYVFETEEDACNFIKEDYEKQLQLQESLHNVDTTSGSGTYIASGNSRAFITLSNGDVMSWDIATVVDKRSSKSDAVHSSKDRSLETEEVIGNTIEVDLGNGTKLCAESNYYDPDYKEVYVFLKDKDGLAKQDLVVAGQSYTYGPEGEIIQHEGRFFVKVYSDETQEGYTHEFDIPEYREEDDNE